MSDIYSIAQRTSSSLDAVGQVYQRFAQNAGSLGLSLGQVATLFTLTEDQINTIRAAQHSDKKFDSFAFVECEPSALNLVESIFIHTYRPKLNFARVAGYVAAPVSWEDVKRTALAYHDALSGANQ